MKKHPYALPLAAGLILAIAAFVVSQLECPSERTDYIQMLWVATGLSMVAGMAVFVGILIWMSRPE